MQEIHILQTSPYIHWELYCLDLINQMFSQVAKSNKLKIVTMDKDFEKVEDVDVIFL